MTEQLDLMRDEYQQSVYEPIRGMGYVLFLKALHEEIKPNWYLEIGSLKGNSLGPVTANVISVDPYTQVGVPSFANKKEIHLFQMTSDDFFESGRLGQIAPPIDFSFLDGMHLFEYLLRDFINAEKASAINGLIAMHDCVPMSVAAADRERGMSKNNAWTGDVWKVVPILRKYRPDLKIHILDCPPSGLTVVTGLDPRNTVLQDNYDQIIADFMDETIVSYGADRLYEELKVQSSLSETIVAEIAASRNG